MPTALITLGRLPKALAIARALKTQGYRIIVAEPFGWHVSRVSRDVAQSYVLPSPNKNPAAYREALLDLVHSESIDVVVPISEEAHYVLGIRHLLPPGVVLFGPEEHVYRCLADKSAFIELADSKGLAVPASGKASDQRAVEIASNCDYITKPINGCSGMDVEAHAAGTPLAQRDASVLVQQKIEGRVVSSLSLVRQGEVQATAVYRGQVYAGTVAICFEREGTDVGQGIQNWIKTFLEDLDYTGFIGFDFIVDSQGIAQAIECNPRLTSGVHFFDESSLGRAITAPVPVPPQPHAIGRWQWRYSTLTEAYSALFAGDFREFRRRLKLSWSVSDVVWSWRDPLPFLLMTPLSWPILKPALFEGVSLGEACQRDISPLWASSVEGDIRRVGSEA